ncbi:MAG: HK97-gp10 family putative phage morphogenesis protein [Cetobacterium sp.]
MEMIVNNFGEAKRKLREGMNNSLNMAGIYLVGRVKLDTPVQTGRLRGSIQHSNHGDLLLGIGTNTEYALAVHEGTRNQRPQRFIYNTTIRELSMLRNIIVEGIKNHVG